MSCPHCSGTGSLSKNLSGSLDCAHCDVATERAALEAWIRTTFTRASMASAWLIHQRGKAAAVPAGYKLVKIDPEWDNVVAAVALNRKNAAALQGQVHTCSNVSLTETQGKVMQFIRDHIASQGRPPTRLDIATHFDWRSVNSAEDHLRRLVDKGYIVLHPGRACGIEIVAQ